MQTLEEENMSEFNFKSSICTPIEQSERLLALGLKKETADCNYPLSMIDGKPCQNCPRIGNPLEQKYDAFPAWSLHRLIKMYVERYISCSVNIKDLTYEWIINEIEIHIKEGDFNKEYLEK